MQARFLAIYRRIVNAALAAEVPMTYAIALADYTAESELGVPDGMPTLVLQAYCAAARRCILTHTSDMGLPPLLRPEGTFCNVV